MFGALKKMFWLVSLGVIVFATVALVSAGTRKVAPRVEEQSLIAAHRTEKPLLTLGTLKSPERQTSEELRALTVGNDAIAPAEAQSNDEQVEVEVITVGTNGFEPSEITRPDGQFILALTNHTEVDELSLHLDRVSGNRVHEVRMRKGRVRWNQVFNLPPGDYRLCQHAEHCLRSNHVCGQDHSGLVQPNERRAAQRVLDTNLPATISGDERLKQPALQSNHRIFS